MYEVDFSTLPNDDIKSDTTHDIDGITWTIDNSAQATSMDIVNGTGLVLVSTSGSEIYSANNRTAPLMHANLQQFISDISFADPLESHLRLWMQITFGADLNENFEFFKGGFEMAVSPSLKHYVGGFGYNSGGFRNQGELSTSTTAHFVSLVATGDDVLLVCYDPPFGFETRSGVYSGGFPDAEEMSYVHSATELATISTLTAGYVTSSNTINSLDIVMAIQPTGSTSTFTATITNFRLERFSSG